MSDAVQIAPVSVAEYGELLPLIAAYQRFYEVEWIRRASVTTPSSAASSTPATRVLLGCPRRRAGFLGYACLYWHFSSTEAVETVLMNDLYVDAEARGRGVGRALIEAGAEVARQRGAARLQWATAPDNHTAQRALRRDRRRAQRVDRVRAGL